MASREKWWEAHERHYTAVDRRDQEQFHLSELTFAAEAESWMNRDTTRDCI